MPDLPTNDDENSSPENPKEQTPVPQNEGRASASETDPRAGRGMDWRLVVIGGIVALFLIAAYVNHKWYGKKPLGAPGAQQPEEGAPNGGPRRPAPSPAEAYRQLITGRELDSKGATFTGPGGRIMVLARPAMPIASKENPRQVQNVVPGKLFDVTNRVEGVKPEMLYRRPIFGGEQYQIAYMDSFPPVGVDPRIKMIVKSAAEIKADPQLDAQLVVGVKVGTQARAYPARMMNYHDVINDTLDGAPILVVWSAWADAASAMYRGDARSPTPGAGAIGSAPAPASEEEEEGNALDDQDAEEAVPTFGSSGLVFQSANVLYDTQTFSLWSATERRCIAGERAGAELKPLEAVVVTWRAWKTLNPGTTVFVGTNPPLQADYNLDPAAPDYVRSENGNPVFPANGLDVTTTPIRPKARVFGVTASDGSSKAYVPGLLQEEKVPFEDQIAGRKVTLEYDPATQWLNAKDADGKPLLTEKMLWVAWFGAHPKTEVWQEEKLRELLRPQGAPGAAPANQKPAPAPIPAGKADTDAAVKPSAKPSTDAAPAAKPAPVPGAR